MAVKKGKKQQKGRVKRNSQKQTKLSSQGKVKKLKRIKAPDRKLTMTKAWDREEDEESIHGEDMLHMMEAEDVEFLKKAITDGRYSILEPHRPKDHLRQRKRALDDDSIEEMYNRNIPDYQTKRNKFLLPIKTSSGVVLRTTEEEGEEWKEGGGGGGEVAETSHHKETDSDEEIIPQKSNDVDTSQPLSTADLLVSREAMVHERKLYIGVLCSGLLENPELKVNNLKVLLNMLEEKSDVQLSVQKLAAASLLEVFKDILPGYQIKHHEASEVKLKKETLKLQGYEKTLLKYYKNYLQIMEKFTQVLRKSSENTAVGSRILGELAVRCLCNLLVMHPYFNFSVNLVHLLIPFLNHKICSIRDEVANSIQTVLRQDRRGEISLKIVQCINTLVKRLTHVTHCQVLTVLLAVKIKDTNLDQEKEAEIKQKKYMNHKQKLLRMSKKERKKSKRLEQLEKELLETKAEENKRTKQQFLTEITKVVFTIYFRILKTAPSSKLLGTTLEGVAKFAHCINVEFYHDLVNVLNCIIESEDLGYREQLHCVQTIFKILSGQGEVLNVDPSTFYTHLYRNVLVITAGRNYLDFPILLHTINSAIIQCSRRVSRQRVFAFVKRLSTLALQVLHNGSLSCLVLIKRIIQVNRFLDALLDTDNSFGGVYLPELEEPEYCNANTSTLWELVALRRHYHPTVRKYSEHILYGCPSTGEGSLSPTLAKLSADRIHDDFSPLEMSFQPAVPVPQHRPRQ
ncbi:nucleolar complex protein 3 isoform X2 [Anabrus simplex]|uniref:nucleolar complex protein 3 isoform X2 n=1 Tax=Anabrus simplex TaxID=316456 RepID=UPI0035A36DAD